MVVGGDVTNQADFVVQGAGDSSVTGSLINSGSVTFGNGTAATELSVAALQNAAAGTLEFLPAATLVVTGAISNAGDVSFQMADFELAASATLTNSGNWTLTSGTYTNRGTTMNASGGVFGLASGTLDNWAQVSNAGEINVTFGSYLNRGTTTNTGDLTLTRGDFENRSGGTFTNQGTLTLSNGAYLNQGTTQNTGGTVALSQGDFENQTGGTVTNSGTIRVENGSYLNKATTTNQSGGSITVSTGNLENQTGGTLTNQGQIALGNGNYVNQGTTTNQSTITVSAGNFANQAGTVTNSGTTTVAAGDYVNQATTANQANGLIAVGSGKFRNESGTVTNDGEIRVTQGNYDNRSTTSNKATIALTNGDFQNHTGATVSNASTGAICVASGDYLNEGSTENSGTLTLSAGDLGNDMTFVNQSAGTVIITTGRFVNRGTTENYGTIRAASGAYENYGTTDNRGTIAISSGNFINQAGGALTNRSAGNILVQSGNFENQVGASLTNDGAIQVSSGAFNSRGPMSGDGQLHVNGTSTFYAGSTLQGNPTITATSLLLQGTVAPGTDGTVGQMTFNADTRFQGLVLFDLVSPGSAGVGSDLIRITGGQTGTLESGTQFGFHVENLLGGIGDKYEIIRGNVALEARPLVTDDVGVGRRIVLRTDQDVNGFASQGTAYYALLARDASFGQMARLHDASGNVVTFGRYLDMALPEDDRTIGTTNADLQWVRDTLDLMPLQSSVVRAMGQMTGEVYVPLGTVALERQFIAYNRFANRLRENLFQSCNLDQLDAHCRWGSTGSSGDDGSDARGESDGWASLPVRGWVSGYGFGGSIDADLNASGCSYGGGGLQVAFGYQPTDRLGFGIFYDFGAFQLDHDLGDTIDAQMHSFGGYLGWHRDSDYCLFVGGGGFANYDSTRYIEFSSPENTIARRAQGNAHGGQAAFYGEYGRNLQWENAHLRPYLGLLYMTVIQNAFEETGAGALNLSFEESAIDSFRTLVGGQFDFRRSDAASLVWTFHGAWVHEYLSEATGGTLTASLAATPSVSYLLAGPSIGNDSVLAGCGVRGAFFAERLRPFANYDVLASTSRALHLVSAGLEYVW